YNMIFPVWSLYVIPFAWVVILPANFLIDTIVVLIALLLMRTGNIKGIYKKIIFKVWGLGFAADILGVISLMIIFGLADDITQYKYRGLAYNAHAWPLGLALISAGVIISGILIYAFNYYGHFKELEMEEKQKKRLALTLAIVTAPYLMFLPPEMLY
ncbi:MAG TPA: hypothetical protein VN580_08380, partial [Clostridia bacterium]|nr:hypothetical protein [Clostridia bacterium]